MGDLSTDFFLYQKLNQPTHAQLNACSNKTASLTAKSQSNILRSTGRLFELFVVQFTQTTSVLAYVTTVWVIFPVKTTTVLVNSSAITTSKQLQGSQGATGKQC